MDRLDKISIAAIAALVLGAGILMVSNRGVQRPDRKDQQKIAAAAEDPAIAAEMDKAARLIRNLIEAGNHARAEGLVSDLMRKYPYQGQPHMLRGDLFMRKQDPVSAMHEYRQAIDLNPDYLDKKTPLFQAKKLKVAVGEALIEIDARLKQNPGDASLKSEKKTIYYLYRRIAGSCG